MCKTISSRPSPMGRCFILLLFLAATLPAATFAHGNKDGLDIKIRAENRSDADTPAFCPESGSPGLVGDRLDADVTTGPDGSATGTAVFTGADGSQIVMNIDQVFVYFGGLALLDSNTRNTVAIWLGDGEEGGPSFSPVHISVEIFRGCANTISTFTVDVDKVTTQIKFQ